LNYIVTIRIFDKDECMLSNFKHKTHLLVNLRPVYAFLHDTAAMLMTCNLHTLVNHGIIYKLVKLRLPS